MKHAGILLPDRRRTGPSGIQTLSLSMEMTNPSRETKFSGANGDGEILIFPVQMTPSRIGNLTRLILTLAICYGHTYTHTRRWGTGGIPESIFRHLSYLQTTIGR